MDNKHQKFSQTLFFSALSIAAVVLTPAAYAANATMSLNPATGSYNNTFSVDLVIDGNGEAFNAAKATIEASSGLRINDVFLGNCNFSFITTPTAANPSFVGTILGDSSEQCTVYTLSLTPVAQGTGLITISDASIKQYGDAEEILQSIQGGTYTITGESSTTSEEDTTAESSSQTQNPAPESDPGLTTVALKIVDENNNPIGDATVLLTSTDEEDTTSNTQSAQNKSTNQQQSTFQATTDKDGIAYITNVPSGIHAIEVKNDDKQIANKIVNVPPNETVMRLGIQEQKEAIGWIEIALIITAFLITGAIIIIYFRGTLLQLFQKLMKKTA
jgi:hypothetical protein